MNTNNIEQYPPETGQEQTQPVPEIPPKPQVVASPVVQPSMPPLVVAPVVDTPNIEDPNKKSKKGFWHKAWNKNKLKNPDAVAVLFLHEKRMAEPMILKPIKGFFNIKGKTYHERDDCTYTMKGKDRFPLAIIKEWAIIPLGTEDWDEKEVQEKVSLFQDHAIKGIRHAERVRLGERNEMKMNGKAMIGIGIMAIIGVALLISYI